MSPCEEIGRKVRHAGDCGKARLLTEGEEAAEHIKRAGEFLELPQRLIGPLLPEPLADAATPA